MKKYFYLLISLIVVILVFIILNCQQPQTNKTNDTNNSIINPKYSTQAKKIMESIPEVNAYYGMFVSISGDYAIVGVPGENNGGTDRGVAYILNRNKGGTDNWGEVKKLTVSDGADNDNFGDAVAIYGDYAVVGAPYKDFNGCTDSGAIYIFNKDKGGTDNWGLVKEIDYIGNNNSNFGWSISLFKDTIAVGIPYEDTSKGDVNIYYQNQGGSDNWGFIKKIPNPATSNVDDYFGISVSICGDYLAVGATQRGEGGTNRGAVFVFYRNEGGADSWGQKKKILPQDPADNDLFGRGLKVDGDYLIAGASSKNSGKGAGYIFNRNQGGADNWGQVKKIYDPDETNVVHYGMGISICGDYAIAGAFAKGAAGLCYIYYRNQGGTENWGEISRISSADQGYSGWFGYSISMTPDYAIIGAGNNSEGGSFRGAAYIFK